MKYISSLLIFVFVVSSVFSQNRLLTIEEATQGYYDKYTNQLYPEYYRAVNSMAQLQWRKNTETYTYVYNKSLYEGTVKGKSDKELVNLDGDLNKVLNKSGFDSLRSFPRINWISENQFSYIVKNQLFVYDVKAKSVGVTNSWDISAANHDFCDANQALAYTIDDDLYISTNTNDDVRVTNDGGKGIVNGQAVHRREFGIEKGTFWSPKGNLIAFYKKDESMVSDYPIIDYSTRVATNASVKYPMAGMTSEEVKVGIYNVAKKSTIFLKAGNPKDRYFTNITWSNDEKFIYIAEINRGQNHLKLTKYDAATGELVKTLFEEQDKKYVEPEHGPMFFKTKPDQFLWFSERNGFNHLYLYNTDGELISQVTDGKFEVIEFIGFNETETNVIYKAVDEEFPLQKHIYSINLETLEVVKLSTADGVHRATLNDNSKFLIDYYSSSKIAHEIVLIDINGMIQKKVYENYNTFKDFKMGEIEVGTVKADDGTDLYYRVIKPADFDPSKKYPVIVYLYGGPHMQLIEDSWRNGAFLLLEYWAQQGFVVFSLDNRGSEHRGFKFESAVHRNMGTKEVSDQAKGVEFLKKQSYVDPDRIGIHGWSYGGFMTLSCMVKNPDLYKVGVSGAPVVDWQYYEVMYGERYMDTPEENPDGYKESNVINHIGDLKGKLMVIHGSADETVVLQHTLKLVEAAVNKGIPIDYFIYPGHEHGVRGAARLHLNKKITQYFIDNL